jgi:hypothetical protein
VVSALRCAIGEVEQRWSVVGWVTKYYLYLFRASEGKLSRWWFSPFSLCIIHKEGLCPSSGGINRLMMMMMMIQRDFLTERKRFVFNFLPQPVLKYSLIESFSTWKLYFKTSKSFIRDNVHQQND